MCENSIAIVYNTCLSQAKYKQAREERKMLLTPAHKYMIELLAHRLYLEPTAVEEFILDSPSVSFPMRSSFPTGEKTHELSFFSGKLDK